MSCNRFEEFLQGREKNTSLEIPDDLIAHFKKCSPCAEKVKKFTVDSSKEESFSGASARNFEDSPQTHTPSMAFGGHTPHRGDSGPLEDTPGNSPFFSRSFFGIMVVAVLGIFSFFGISQFNSGVSRAGEKEGLSAGYQKKEIAVSGFSGYLEVLNGERTPLSNDFVKVPEKTLLFLKEQSSSASIIIPDGSSFSIVGVGEFTLAEDGFFTKDAVCQTKFRPGPTGIRVKLPVATLGIRGTTILFSVASGKGEIELIEGKVTVSPEARNQSVFELLPGKKIVLTSTEVIQKTSPGDTSGGTSSQPRSPDHPKPANEPTSAPSLFK